MQLFLRGTFQLDDLSVIQEVWSLRNGRKDYVNLHVWGLISKQSKTLKRFYVLGSHPPPKLLYASMQKISMDNLLSVSYTHLRAHETGRNLVCRLLLEKKK